MVPHVTGLLPPLTRRADRWRAVAWTTALTAVVFAVGFDQGAVTAGTPLFHEIFHDARHLLGMPCH